MMLLSRAKRVSTPFEFGSDGILIYLASNLILIFNEETMIVRMLFARKYLVLLVLVLGFAFWGTVLSSQYPFEDAAILMRYAKHLAQGYGIRWNVGEAPVDGATDFLFMVAVAGLHALGLSLEAATRGLAFVAHGITVLLVFFSARRIAGIAAAMAFFIACYLAVGPGLAYVSAYFGTPFFALFAALAWWCALRLSQTNFKRKHSVLFALFGLLAGLTRPEGVFLSCFILIAVLVKRRTKNFIPILFDFCVIFLVAGGGYFLWRWNYFGYPLPNPFYKKGGGYFDPFNFLNSMKRVVEMASIFFPSLLLGFRSREKAASTLFCLMPLVAFSALWSIVSDEMNYQYRFQYVALPLVLLSVPGTISGLYKELGLSRLEREVQRTKIVFQIVLYGCGTLFLVQTYHQFASMRHSRDGRYDVAKILSRYEGRGYGIATTEAGLLPLYSNWRALDAWGLNDQRIAHRGRLLTTDLGEFRPEVIMFHSHFSPLTGVEGEGTWYDMVVLMKQYAENNRYILAACFGIDPTDVHYYYVRADFADSKDIVGAIRKLKYPFYTTGEQSLNFSEFQKIL